MVGIRLSRRGSKDQALVKIPLSAPHELLPFCYPKPNTFSHFGLLRKPTLDLLVAESDSHRMSLRGRRRAVKLNRSRVLAHGTERGHTGCLGSIRVPRTICPREGWRELAETPVELSGRCLRFILIRVGQRADEAATAYPLKETRCNLPQKQQLPRLHPIPCREPVEVHTRRQFQSGIGHTIPWSRMPNLTTAMERSCTFPGRPMVATKTSSRSASTR